jgi:peptide/nickel transport system ATP-binding protein
VSALLEVADLQISLDRGGQQVVAVDEVSFTLSAGEVMGLVGESGCGKSLTGLSLMGLLQPPLGVSGGRIMFQGQALHEFDNREWQRIRGTEIAMIFQEPMMALNPVMRVGAQVAEMFRLHRGASRREAWSMAIDALAAVRIPAPERRADDYPHQLSGGMRQRVMIAIALACRPKLLIADEPTTALDMSVQAQVLDLMAELCESQGTALLLISHDLGLVAQRCSEVAVMYAGKIVESQAADRLFSEPQHPYTQGLLKSLPRLGDRARVGQQPLTEIPGVVPGLGQFPSGCAFRNRCDRAADRCEQEPLASELSSGGYVRCHLHG